MAKTCWSIGLAAVFALAGLTWSATAQQPYAAASLSSGLGARDLITHFLPIEGKPTTLTVIDPQTRAIGVYHISRETGEIELKSVRNFGSDLQLEAFNSRRLPPKEIREGLERVQ